MHVGHFPDFLHDHSVLSRLEKNTKSRLKSYEDEPYCATQYQDVFARCDKGVEFAAVKPSKMFSDVQLNNTIQ